MVRRKLFVPVVIVTLLSISAAGVCLYLFYPRAPLPAGMKVDMCAPGIWIHAILRHPRTPLPAGTKVDRVIVIKHEKKLMLVKEGKVLKTYRVALGCRKGRKIRQGDCRTPEGVYKLYRLYKNDDSRYHTALRITYPNEDDKKLAKKLGITNLGGDIEIHGMGKCRKMFPGGLERLHWLVNWTVGCIAVTDEEADEIYDAVPDGTPIEIKP